MPRENNRKLKSYVCKLYRTLLRFEWPSVCKFPPQVRAVKSVAIGFRLIYWCCLRARDTHKKKKELGNNHPCREVFFLFHKVRKKGVNPSVFFLKETSNCILQVEWMSWRGSVCVSRLFSTCIGKRSLSISNSHSSRSLPFFIPVTLFSSSSPIDSIELRRPIMNPPKPSLRIP